MELLVFETVCKGRDRPYYWHENKALGEEDLKGGYLNILLYYSNFFSLSLVRKEPEVELKGQNIKTSSFDLTTYKLFTVWKSKARMSRTVVFITMIRVKNEYKF